MKFGKGWSGRRWRQLALRTATLAAATTTAMPTDSYAAFRFWVDGVAAGDWHNGLNWAATQGGAGGAGVPGSADFARITHTNATNYNVTLNGNAFVQGFAIGNGGTGTNTLTQSGG